MLYIKKKIKKISNINYIDLFSGIGGFRLALDSFGARCVFSSEINKFSSRVYEKNFREKPSGDITKITTEKIPSHDILCAGFPCQAFSISGKQKGFKDSRGTLFFDIARILKSHNPRVLILENVKNILTHDSGETLRTILRILNELDYDVSLELLTATYFGVPQHRQRIFFIGTKKYLGFKNLKLSNPNYKQLVVKDILELNVEVENNISFDLVKFRNKSKQDHVGTYSHRPLRIGTINKGGQGERIYSINSPGITLSAYGGGIANKTGAYLIDKKIRKLTVRECARMMGFPDNFQICENKNQAYTQFGNSVVVNIVEHIVYDLITQNVL